MLLLLIKCLEAVGWVPAPSTDGQVYYAERGMRNFDHV